MKAPRPRRLILLRHAHRSTRRPSLDNGLSARGQRQARRAFLAFEELGLKPDLPLVSSPLQRCRETLNPWREKGARPRIDPALLPRSQKERSDDFRRRVKSWLDRWRRGRRTELLVCSHGDWIPLAAELVCGKTVTVRKGGWQVLFVRGKFSVPGNSFRVRVEGP